MRLFCGFFKHFEKVSSANWLKILAFTRYINETLLGIGKKLRKDNRRQKMQAFLIFSFTVYL